MGMMDILCSSPASTATRKSHHETTTTSISITPRLIRVLSTPCRSVASTDVDPLCHKPAVSRHEYKQLLQKQRSDRISTSGRSSCGADGGLNISGVHIRRKSSAGISDVKVSSTSKETMLSDTCGIPMVLAGGSCRISIKQENDIRKSSRSGSSGSATGSVNEYNDSPKLKSLAPSRSSSGYHNSADKVVVLWVSLHCKGCEAKVRKHISKMEGVKSFSTDWMTKRVTIISNMDPHDVLASVSTVKYARFWPSSSSSSSHHYSPSPSSSSTVSLFASTR